MTTPTPARPASAPAPGARAGARPRWLTAELVPPVLLLGLGGVVVAQAATIAVPISAGTVGPRAFPYAVGVLLLLTGAGLLVQVLRGARAELEDGEDVDASRSTDWPTVAKLVASFVLLAVLVEPLGWPVAATVLFTGVAWSLGARPWWRAALVGVVLAVLTHVLFTRVLGIFLPAGPLEGVLGG